MRIALIGEFSSLHKYLKEGIAELGNEVVLVSSGDGYKQIQGADIILPQPQNSSILHRLEYARDLNSIINQIEDYDIVQIIHSNCFPIANNSSIVKRLKSKNGKLSLLSAGSDYAFYRAYRTKKYKYHPYNFFPPSMYENGLKGMWERLSAEYVEKISDVIIPSLYEYSLGYDSQKLYKVIPFPINTKEVEFKENDIYNRIVFFHGLNREIKKGTPLIREALEKLQEKYPNDVEVIIDGHMPFNKYIELMRKVNVVVDQTYGYGYGINSCLALAQGKIVVNPCKQEQIEAMKADYNPFVTIYPSVDDIFNKLCMIIERKSEISEMAIKGRRFVETYHDYIKVSKMYLDAWGSILNTRR